MTIGTAGNRLSFNCDGSTTVFPIALQAYLAADFDVYLTAPAASGGAQTKLILNSDYTLATSGTLTPPQWSLTTITAYATGYTLQALVDPAQVQQSVYTQGQAFPSLSVQTNFDRLTQMVQRLQDQLSRSVRVPDGDVAPNMLLPMAAQRAGLAPVFDSNGNLVLGALTAGVLTGTGVLGLLGDSAYRYALTPKEQLAGLTTANIKFGYDPGNFLRYGADPTGVADCTPAFTVAKQALCSYSSGGTSTAAAAALYLPAGTYNVLSTINHTNTRQTGTYSFDGFIMYGDGMWQTTIVGNTGSGHAILETSGAQHYTLRDLQLAAGVSNASTVGLLQAVGSLNAQTQNQHYERVWINLPDANGANGGAGSVGIWNYGSEETTYHSIYVQANTAGMFTTQVAPQNGYTMPASYVSLYPTAHSLGNTTFSGEGFMVGIVQRCPAIVTENCGAFDLGSTYISSLGTSSGVTNTAWRVYGLLSGTHHGIVEQYGRYQEVIGQVQNFKARIVFGGISATGTERLNLQYTGSQGQLDDCEYHFTDTTSPNRYMIVSGASATNTLVPQFIRNTEITANCDKAWIGLGNSGFENTLWNPNTGNVTFRCLRNSTQPFRYYIDSQRRHEVDIPDTPCLVNGGISSAEIVRFLKPTVVSTANALSADVLVEGIAHCTGPGTSGGASTRLIQSHISLALSTTGTATATTDGTSNTTANVSGASNNITGFVLSAVDAGAYVQIIATPTRTGANNDTVSFTGTAKMRWFGNESRAPSLQTLS